jgi:hypothetical protein
MFLVSSLIIMFSERILYLLLYNSIKGTATIIPKIPKDNQRSKSQGIFPRDVNWHFGKNDWLWQIVIDNLNNPESN